MSAQPASTAQGGPDVDPVGADKDSTAQGGLDNIQPAPAPCLEAATNADPHNAQQQQQDLVMEAAADTGASTLAAVLPAQLQAAAGRSEGDAAPQPCVQQAAAAGEADATLHSAATAQQPAGKRGRPGKDKQATPRKKPCKGKGSDLGAAQQEGSAAAAGAGAMQQPAASGNACSQVLLQQQQQQQQLLSFVAGSGATAAAGADCAGKQRKQVRRPPKTAAQQQGKGESCCFSLERPFGSLSAATGHHSLMPPGFQQNPQHSTWVLQQQMQSQAQQPQLQQGLGGAMDGVRPVQGQDSDAAAAGLKTRLSVRSVACIEELLQQTAHAAGRGGGAGAAPGAPAGAGSSSGSGQAAHPARPAGLKGSVAVTSRLSVGNLLISPPMSRAPSMCINPLPPGVLEMGAPPGKAQRPGSAAAADAMDAGKGGLSKAAAQTKKPAAGRAVAAAAADKKTALLPLNLAFPQAPGKGANPAVAGPDTAAGQKAATQAEGRLAPGGSSSARTSTRQLLAATMAALEQQQQVAAAAGLLPLPAAVPSSRRSRIGIPQLQAAVAAAAAAAVAGVAAAAPASSNPNNPADAHRKLPTAAEINRAAAAAVAAFQMSAAAAAAAAAAAGRDDGGSSSDTSSSGDDDRATMNAAAWTAYRSGMGGTPNGAGAASAERLKQGAKLQGEACSSSDTESPPSSPSSPARRDVLGVLTSSLGGLGHAAGPGSQQAGVQERMPLHARKSDRQVGLETVSRIDAIFQQLRSLQPPAAAGCTGLDADPCAAGTLLSEPGGAAAALAALAAPPSAAAAAAAATGGAETTTAAAGAAAGSGGAGAAAEMMGCSVAALCRGLRYEGDITLKEVAMAFQLRDAYDWDEDLEAAVAAHEARKREDPRLKDVKAVVKPTASADSSVCPDPEPVPGFQPRSTWMAGQRAPSTSPPPSAMGAQHRGTSRLRQDGHPAAAGIAPAVMQRLHRQSSQQSNSHHGSVNSSRRSSLAGSPVNAPHSGTDPMAPAALQAALTAAVTAAFSGQHSQGVTAMLPGLLGCNPAAGGADQQAGANPNAAASNALLEMYTRAFMAANASTGATSSGGSKRGGRKRKGDSDDEYDPRKPSHNQEFTCRKPYAQRASTASGQQQARPLASAGSWCGGSMFPAAMQQALALAGMQPAQQWQVLEQQLLLQQQRMLQVEQQGPASQQQQQHANHAAAAAGSNQLHTQPVPPGEGSAPVRSRPSYVRRRLVGGAASSWLHMQDGLPTAQYGDDQQQRMQPLAELSRVQQQPGLGLPPNSSTGGAAAAARGSSGSRKPSTAGVAAAAARPGRGRRPSYVQLEAGNFSDEDSELEAASEGRLPGSDGSCRTSQDGAASDAVSEEDTQSDCSDEEAGYSTGRGRGRRGGRGARGGRARGPGGRGRGRGRLAAGAAAVATDPVQTAPAAAPVIAATAGAATAVVGDAAAVAAAAAAAADHPSMAGDLPVSTAARGRGRGHGRGRGRTNSAGSSPAVSAEGPAGSSGTAGAATGAGDAVAAAAAADGITSGVQPGFTVGSSRGGRRGQGRRGAFAGRSSPLVNSSSGAAGQAAPPGKPGSSRSGAASKAGGGRGRGARSGRSGCRRSGRGGGRGLSIDPTPSRVGAAAAGSQTPGSGSGLKSMPSWFAAGLLLPDVLDTAAAAAASELLGGPGAAGAPADLAGLPGAAAQQQAPEEQQGLLSPGSVQLQQLAGLAGKGQQQQQQQARKGWETQVADGGVLVAVPAEGPLQEGGDLGGMDDPLGELLLMGGRVHVSAGGDAGDVDML